MICVGDRSTDQSAAAAGVTSSSSSSSSFRHNLNGSSSSSSSRRGGGDVVYNLYKQREREITRGGCRDGCLTAAEKRDVMARLEAQYCQMFRLQNTTKISVILPTRLIIVNC